VVFKWEPKLYTCSHLLQLQQGRVKEKRERTQLVYESARASELELAAEKKLLLLLLQKQAGCSRAG